MGVSFRLFLVLCAVVLGGCLGSFLNVAVWRLPAGKSLVRPASFCPKCGHAIRFYDNIPVFGWIFLRGKCRDCHQPISPRYPVIEGVVAAMGGILGFLFFFAQRGVPVGIFRWEGLAQRLSACEAYWRGETLFPTVSFESVVFVGFGVTLLWLCILCIYLGLGLVRYDGHRLSPLVQAGLYVGAFLLLGEASFVPILGTLLCRPLSSLFGPGAYRRTFLLFFILFFATLTGIILLYGRTTPIL
jgi:prepilin signal peptidase PulO-like enzyme (type II secretory pathway)